MRVSLIGPGDIDFHFYKLLQIPQEKFQNEVKGIAKALMDAEVQIELLPDKGISLEVARRYKELGGKSVIGSAPLSDKAIGTKHLTNYIEEKINNQNLFDEIIDSGDWYKHDMIKGLMGNVLLYLGSSPGTDGERHYAVYLYKLIKKFKKGVELSAKHLHPELQANEKYTIFIYSPFLMHKTLPKEDEAYLEEFEIPYHYINSPEELKEKLTEIQK